MSNRKPIILGSALLMGFYSLYHHATQKPIVTREDFLPKKSQTNTLAQTNQEMSFRNKVLWLNDRIKYGNLQSHNAKIKKDFLGRYMFISRCTSCGSEEVVRFIRRRKNNKLSSQSNSKYEKEDSSSIEFLPRILQDRSSMSNHLQQFLHLLPDASKCTYPLHTLGFYPTCFFKRTSIRRKSVSFSTQTECLLYDA